MARQILKTLTEPMYYLLLALYKEKSGAEIVSFVSDITDGRVEMPPGTLYALLARFVEEELIELSKAKGNSKKYIITELGKNILQEERNRLLKLINDYTKYVENN